MYYTPTATISVNYWKEPLKLNKHIKEDEFLTPQDIINAACRGFNVTPLQITSKTRKRYIVIVRDIIIYIIRLKVRVRDKKNKLREMSLKEIGRLFNRDHTTILTAIGRVKNDLSLMHTRQQMNEDLRMVMELI